LVILNFKWRQNKTKGEEMMLLMQTQCSRRKYDY
jgi:hypothetical protein